MGIAFINLKVEGVSHHIIDFQIAHLCSQQRGHRATHNFFNLFRSLERNNDRWDFHTQVLPKKIPAVSCHIQVYRLWQVFGRGIFLSIKFKEYRETNVGGVILIERIENPEYHGCEHTQTHNLPVGPIESKKINKNAYNIHGLNTVLKQWSKSGGRLLVGKCLGRLHGDSRLRKLYAGTALHFQNDSIVLNFRYSSVRPTDRYHIVAFSSEEH